MTFGFLPQRHGLPYRESKDRHFHVLSVGMIIMAIAAAGTPTIAQTCIDRYSFNGNANDSVGTANGTVVGSVSFQSSPYGNGSADFSGGTSGSSPGYISLPVSTVSSLQNCTIEIFTTNFTPPNNAADTAGGQGQTLFAAANAYGTTSNYVLLSANQMNQSNPSTPVPGGIGVMSQVNSGGNLQVLAHDPLPDWQTNHVIDLVFSGFNGIGSTGTETIYLDGNQVAQGSTTNSFASVAAGSGGISVVAIGGGSPFNDPSFNGSINELRIYNDALSTAQMAASIAAGPSVLLPQTATVSVTPSTSSPSTGQSVTFTISVAGGSPQPTGTVSLSNGTSILGSGTLLNGTATVTTSFATTGVKSITAIYSGDANYAYASGTTTVDVGGTGVSGHVLWTNGGAASIWSVALSTGAFTQNSFGPYAGWSATAIADGPDGMTRVLWASTAGAVSIWNLDAATGVFTQNSFGPYPGWTADGLSVGTDNTTHVLWTNAGQAAIWNLNATTGAFTQMSYGPFKGWSATTISDGQDGELRTLWLSSAGAASIWNLDNDTGAFNQNSYGPFAGWTPGPISVGADNTTHIVWTTASGQASIWNYAVATGAFTQMSYGPYPDWWTTAIADGSDGLTRVLWVSTNTASLWNLNNNTGAMTQTTYGPYPGWSATGLTIWP
ncbi:MAG: Ig-like domain repeat protein [Capsulimonadaceae bacterium]